MDAPLGWAIGNALEVMESVEILRGEHGDSELAQLSFRLAAEMLIMGGAATTLEQAQAKVQASIQGGTALTTLRRFVTLNGGDARALEDFSRLPQPGRIVEIRSERAGYVSAIDGRALGLLAMDLGAGRRNRDDVLDLGVGIRVHVKVGSKIEKNDKLFTVYIKHKDRVVSEDYLSTLQVISDSQSVKTWLLETIDC
jgi:pyrimidine-nucleoside phosphorylase